MGERHSGDGLSGRRHAHPGGTLSTPRPADAGPGASRFEAEFEARLGAALRADGVDPEAERGAVAAFRAARAAGAQGARTRPRDDWRPAAPRAARRSLRTVLSVALASLALGGVAVAAIGSAGHGRDSGRDAPRPAHPSAGAPRPPAADPSGTASPTPSGAPSTHPPHPATARDTLAHCRAFEKAGEHGHALDATAWQRLVTAAGGTDKVPAYCAAQLVHDSTGNGRSSTNGPKADRTGAHSEPSAARTQPADGKK